MDINAALKQYGFVGALANSIPELKAILTKAARGNWSVDEFSRAVQDSRWWKRSEDAVKQYQILRVTKPGEFKAQRATIVNRVRTIAAEMGVGGLGEGRGSALAHLVEMAQMHGWDEATLRQQIGGRLQGARATFGGQAGAVQQQIRQLYTDYGLRYSSYTVNLQVRAILSGRQTVEGVQALVTNQAQHAFPGLAQQIAAGHTVAEIAQPYLQTKAQLLEVPPETVTLQDATVRRALMHKDPKSGQVGVQPLWEYEQVVKKDKRWDTTKNANNDYAALAQQLGHDWGYSA